MSSIYPECCNVKAGSGQDIPPPIAYVRIYFLQQGMSCQQADVFYKRHQEASWLNRKGKPLRSWKTQACDWIWEYKQALKSKA